MNEESEAITKGDLAKKMTPQQLAMLIKVQARIRGMITRNKVRGVKNIGLMSNMRIVGVDGQIIKNYDNEKVQVSAPCSNVSPANSSRAGRFRLPRRPWTRVRGPA